MSVTWFKACVKESSFPRTRKPPKSREAAFPFPMPPCFPDFVHYANSPKKDGSWWSGVTLTTHPERLYGLL